MKRIAGAGTDSKMHVGNGERVLVVEDNAALRRSVMLLLKVLRYDPIEAENPQDALRTLETKKIDLLFTDLMMPGGMSGVELARRATERLPALRVLLTSGLSVSVMDPLIDTSARQFPLLNKPYRLHELAQALRQIFGEGHATGAEPAPRG